MAGSMWFWISSRFKQGRGWINPSTPNPVIAGFISFAPLQLLWMPRFALRCRDDEIFSVLERHRADVTFVNNNLSIVLCSIGTLHSTVVLIQNFPDVRCNYVGSSQNLHPPLFYSLETTFFYRVYCTKIQNNRRYVYRILC